MTGSTLSASGKRVRYLQPTRLHVARLWHGVRNKFGQPMYSTEDFIALELHAGRPPKVMAHQPQMNSAELIQDRLTHIQKCDEFNKEYFDPRYPYAEWHEFYREYQVWLAFNKEKENEKSLCDLGDANTGCI